jgi:cyclophilin family peptidyl-prolyl cis-trans isomerase
MCNKQKPFVKNNSMKCSFSHLFYSLLLSTIFLMNISCATQELQLSAPVEVDQDFITLSEAIVTRDLELLWNLKESPNERISGAAWRALAITQMDDLGELFDYAMDTDDPNAWYVLRFQNLSKEDIEKISIHFFTSNAERGPICSLFFSQSDRWTLDMLLDNSNLILENPKCAMAVGGMLTRIEAGQGNMNRVMELLHESGDDQIKSFLLYGYWRSGMNRPAPDSAAYGELYRALENRAASEPALVDEFSVRLTNERGLKFIMSNRSDRELSENVQLSVELARSVRHLSGEDLDKEMIYRLLNHPNPHVSVMAIESLKELGNLDQTWVNDLSEDLIHFPENAEVSVTYLELLQKNGVGLAEKRSILEGIDQHYPHLKNRTLGLYKEVLDSEVYLERILTHLDSEGIQALHAAMALAEYAGRHHHLAEIRDRVRETLSAAILNQNRSVITVSGQLLTNRYFFDEGDKTLFMSGYAQAVENGNHEVAQLLFGVMLEQNLIEDGFSHEITSNEILMPDWARVLELGEYPHWVLETNRGEIVIQLDPFTAPFTVFSIDSLTRAGMYDGVDFHRVVRNFVIQGGDFDRRDGLGGPGYRVPTEPALYTFDRGMVGMASSGQDTEGSQFFITHTWTPHLDGLYTIFGEVIEGMDVVDRIQIGDVVLKAEIVW